MAPKRAHNNKGPHKPDPTLHKRIKVQVRKILYTPDDFLTSSYHALANVKSQQTQQTHKNVQRTSKRIAQIVATRTQQVANQVFGTNELLEQILLHVGTLEDLIRMRGVNRQWKDVIEGTVSLKQIIFLSPQEPEHVWHTFVSLGPGLPLYKFVKDPKGSWNTDENPGILQSARINPLLFRQLSENENIPVWYTGSRGRWTSEELHLREGARINGTKMKVSSPLLNMFATQPPLEVMMFRTGGDPARQIRNRKGIKVIDVLKVAEGLAGGFEGRVVVDYIIFGR